MASMRLWFLTESPCRPSFGPFAGQARPLILPSVMNGMDAMKIKVVVHDAEEGGFWAEVPAIPGCASQGETMDELLKNLHEAVEGCLSVPPERG